MGPHLQQIKSELDQFRPDLVMCASKGGAYVVGLWEAGLWLGPTLMINAHPTCVRLPRGVPVVLAAGGDDEHYPSTRKALHRLVATGTASHSFLYYAAGSGPRLPPGFAPRPGDRHNMYSLLQNDCLPRLMDAALCPEGAEVHLWPPGPTRTHAALGSESRLRAERPLREALLQRLDAAQRRGAAAWPAPSVEPGSQEFGLVAAAFAAPPRAASAYRFRAAVPFEATRIAAVHRVEPRPDAAAAALRRLAELRGSLEQRGVPFEADVHARWAFYHGCGASALGAGLQHLDAPPPPHRARGRSVASLSGACRRCRRVDAPPAPRRRSCPCPEVGHAPLQEEHSRSATTRTWGRGASTTGWLCLRFL
ncbi:unnamed protein product [Prorocentrum cordatum]|uniref:Uncharacterized protein n=1 Tax=Prorocentrum cordatum TaxID=2364126 RepID=A0ABN9WHZ8_9DINO|nr:unnamed protein product [Polarella glacialis]